ncbi:MAG: homocysteine S-methyltransferase family protein [Nocardioidaceae bacterium]
MLVGLRREAQEAGQTAVVSGCVGPRGDGYDGSALMTAAQARDYHTAQVATFAETDADMANAMTITYPAEAVGIVQAATDVAIPVAISFTVETDGVLPDGTPLAVAVEHVEEATEGAPAYYAINCAHPTHFEQVLDPSDQWVGRLRGIRANASARSHAELDQADQLDSREPGRAGRGLPQLRMRLANLTVLGGCCGTDLRRHPAPRVHREGLEPKTAAAPSALPSVSVQSRIVMV